MTAQANLLSLGRHARIATEVFLKDIGQGLLVVSHNTLALLGLAVVAVLATFASQADLRHQLESQTLGWLSARQEARAEASGDVLNTLSDPSAIQRATAINPKELSRPQAAVAQWLARRYKVAPEPVARLVQEAWVVGQKAKVEPTLILSIMAVESGFNQFAQSTEGAQGLMQVMTRVHDDKYEAFGGTHAAFDPVTNLRVGVQVLKECIQRGGSLEDGLKYYVGAANLSDDAGYAGRVLNEHEQLKAVAAGRSPTPRPSTEPQAPMASSAPQQVALLH